ncbi:UbiA family prenyltransferase [Nesterenkonia xinjiangensis]|uniref:4-hydroxybenzoate polyprenyltransferase n=1 Tax=Nesterenkonia xinjiangensis TaxID=225327 RepID=A0A7Z0GKS1_9MICC|nr:UbiA family prenyltransferase [Nesterenkonia xinjiangensis]NYJ77757.1 4-hydroxybenzoate polyprenyltransferase [Nesterenkonia xinjiangensis]
MGPVLRSIAGLWRSSHPGPTLVVTTLAAALALASGLEIWRILLLAAAVFSGQLSIGISNDAIDAERDRAVGRTDKPIACGEVALRTAWTAAVVLALLALGLSAPLGVGLAGAHAVVLVCGWSYNAGLKTGPLSIAPYVLAFGCFPSLATLAAVDPQLAPGWAWLAGGALGAALHLTNVLPDLDDDARTGVRGTPHRLGPKASVRLAAASVLLGAASATLGPPGGSIPEVTAIGWVVLVLVVAVVLVSLVLARAGSSGRVLFRLVMLAALLLAAQLVASGHSLGT